VDGDTVNVVDDKGGQVRVRVLGIDTPETKDPQEPVQCWGPEASAYAERTLLEKRVSLYTDPTQAVRDTYGRLLAYVVLADGGADYSVAAVGAGAARSYVYAGKPVSNSAAIAAAEQRARSDGLGVWGPPCYGQTIAPSAATASPSDSAPPSTVQPPDSTPTEPIGSDAVYYPNCAAVRTAGRAPLHRGEPGFRTQLDRDGDGQACE
jgi:micrococcal nuclease